MNQLMGQKITPRRKISSALLKHLDFHGVNYPTCNVQLIDQSTTDSSRDGGGGVWFGSAPKWWMILISE